MTIEIFQLEDIDKLPAVSEVATDYKAGSVNKMMANKAATLLASLERVVEPAGDQFKKVTWEEFQKLYCDPHFQSRASYEFDLVYFTNGQRRPRPLRPIAQNEVGIYGGKIVYLADRGPGDLGDRTWQVPISIDKETHMIIDDKLVAVGVDLAAPGTRDVTVEQDVQLIGGKAVPVGPPRYFSPGDTVVYDEIDGKVVEVRKPVLPPEFFDACSSAASSGITETAAQEIGGITLKELLDPKALDLGPVPRYANTTGSPHQLSDDYADAAWMTVQAVRSAEKDDKK